MNSNKKITLIVFTMTSLLSLSIVIMVALSSRQTVYDNVKKRAYLMADVVKKSLTAHMVNENMSQRDVFLNSIEQTQGLEAIWIIRAPSVTEQFSNESLSNEIPRDDIDKKVLKTGIEQLITKETFKSASLRITIPYIASAIDTPNCMSCHNATEGETLGAISLKFNIHYDRTLGIASLVNIIILAIIFSIFILIFTIRKIKPYLSSFDSITEVLKHLHEGNYSIRIQEGSFKEDKETAFWLNEIIEKFEKVLISIEKNLSVFVYNRKSIAKNDKLLVAQAIIEDISKMYHYKKTIETDLTKEDIYYRFTQILKDRLEIDKFCIFENNILKNERTIVHITENTISCCHITNGIKENCRAERTNMVISTENFPEICRSASCTQCKYYVCIPFFISEQQSITIHILCENVEQLKHANAQIGIIKKYLEETKPIIESRLLMDILRERNLVDGLTGLNNRKYLDEFIDKKMPQELEKKTTYAVMFLDIDYFKTINDTYGHDSGDIVLQKLSTLMKNSITQDEFIIRFGGEEFLIIMKNPTQSSAKELATKINEEFSKLVFTFNNISFNKTVSIGYSFFPNDTDQFWKCIKFADLSLYEAKASGRNKVIQFTRKFLKNGNKSDY